MKNPAFVSILISAYNEEQYIRACIESCLSQTHQNLEIILVNDGSRDLTSQIIKQNYRKDSRVKIIELEKNLGKVNGFNIAFAASKGDYVAFMGADDICYSERLQESLKYLIGNHGIVCSDLDKINAKGTIIEKRIIHNQYGSLEPNEFSTKKLIENPKVYGGTILLSRILAEKIFPLDINLSHEDWYIPIMASLHSQIHYIDQPLIAYRIHLNNSSQSSEKLIYNYTRWFYLNTRDTGYYGDLIDLIEKFTIDTDVSKIRFNFAKSSLLKRSDKFTVYGKYLPQIKGIKNKLIFTLHLCSYLLYVLAMFMRLARHYAKKIR